MHASGGWGGGRSTHVPWRRALAGMLLITAGRVAIWVGSGDFNLGQRTKAPRSVGKPVAKVMGGSWSSMRGQGHSVMRYLSPRKTPAMSLHRASGQALVRFVEQREEHHRGPVRDVYLGLHGSAEAHERYDQEIREWVSRSLQVGWAPAGWQPAETGHNGVLTVQGLVEGYRRRLDAVWGLGWRRDEIRAISY